MLKYSTGELYQIMKDFYTLTQIRIVLFDQDFQELLSYPRERFGFCTRIRKNAEDNIKCVESDRIACMKCAQSKELVLYRCHAGLTEAVVPICDKYGVIGYVMFGQILSREGYEEGKKKLKKRYSNSHGGEMDVLIDQIPAKTTEELNAAATVLQALTTYVISKHWVAPGKSEFIRQLDGYIEKHIKENIRIEDLSHTFRIGRTHLYQLASDYLDCGLAEYVRRQRILFAQKLLEDTDLPVSEIACLTGFCDYPHFSRAFKQISGMTAREYRRQRILHVSGMNKMERKK